MSLSHPLSSAGDLVFSLQGVRYRYGGRHLALDGIDLQVRRGEQVVLLGANGCGKSTLLKLLDGIYAPGEGSMRVLGREIKAVADGLDAFQFHREVGLVFQDPDVQLFCATVFDDVAFGPLQLGLSAREVKERCQEAMAVMEITHLAKRAPFELSGGEKKRAAIASVLSLRPDVILLEYEAFGGETHHHLVCRKCKAILHIEHPLQEQLRTAMLQQYQFHQVSVDIMTIGYCDECWQFIAKQQEEDA